MDYEVLTELRDLVEEALDDVEECKGTDPLLIELAETMCKLADLIGKAKRMRRRSKEPDALNAATVAEIFDELTH